MKSKAIELRPEKTEKVRKYLIKNSLIRRDLKIKRKSGFVYIPIKSQDNKINSYKVVKEEFIKIEKKPKNLSDIVLIPNNLKEKLPKSYDIIGDIALIKIDSELLGYKSEIGNSLLKINKNLHTVCLVKPIKGEYRTRNVEIIAGENKSITEHTEYGLKFLVDIKKTYFSPRLATERKRVADLVKTGEIVVDMFAGVSPFSIMIAKYANPKIIYSVDKNKYAVKYGEENIKKNNFLDKIEVIHSDAKNISKLFGKKGIKADRIIMNLPFSAHLFFKNALELIKSSCVIHYYDILKDENMQKRIIKLKKIAKELDISLTKINIKKIKTYAPREFYIGIDIKAKKMPM